MEMATRQIVAFGGGGFSMESGNPLLDDYVLGLTRAERPRVCFLPSASGDADHYIVRFYRAFSAHRCEPSHISLFRREGGPADLRRHLLAQDLIYVGGGSVVSLLGVWRAHGIDSILREAWESGVVLCGLSAGSLCWFAEAVSGFHGEPKRLRGLGLLPFSNCVHYERGSKRGEAYHRFLEPAERAGREAAEDDPRFPRLAQDRVDPVGPPDPEQADDAAAANVDQILGEKMAPQVPRPLLAAEERDVAGLAAVGGEGAVEADDVVVGVAAGRGQEADARPLGPRQRQHVVVEERVAGLHRETAAAEGDYLPRCRLH